MATAEPTRITELLVAIGAGQARAAEELLPLVYDELRRLARARMANESPGQTLQPTALVHEAYIRLLGDEAMHWDSRGHFFAAASEAMRRILVDRARARLAEKRGGSRRRVPLDSDVALTEPPPEDVLALDQALTRLAAIDSRAHDVVMLRYFGGLTVEQIAAALTLSPATVKREWSYTRAWLFDEMTRCEPA